MKKIHLCLIGIATLFLTACTVGVSSNKNSVIKDTDSITNLKVTFNFGEGKYDDQEQYILSDVKPTSYWKYVKAHLDETKITPPEHTTFEGFSFAEDDPSIIQDSYVVKEDITVYAQYKAKEGEYCTVNWMDGGVSPATTIATEQYFVGDTPAFKGTIPYHEGKTFDRWEGIKEIESSDLGKTIDITAIYVPLKTIYNVTLDYDDGSGLHIQKVLNGECAVEPKITKEGYKLDKWDYVSGGTGTFDFSTPISTNIEIKANWTRCYTITWKNYDGTIIKEDKIEEGKSPIKPSNPRRYSTNPFIDYTFKEWSPAVIEEVHSNQTYIATYQTVLYNDTKTCMHITTVDGNKDFAFSCIATSNITVDWGDGTPQEERDPTSEISHTYENTGEFNIRIFNPITSISVSNGDKILIEELYLGEDVTSIGMSAFNGCSKLQTVTFAGESKLTSIGEYAFYDCSSLIGITIPSGVTSIGHNVFNGCSSLTGITIPSGVTLINTNAFNGCSQLQTVTFAGESKLTSIGDAAFMDCSALTNITIPSGVTSIGVSAFNSCSQLQTVTFAGESKLTSIGEYAFYKCFSLTGITIPSGVTSIGKSAFYGGSSITGITIPSSVTSIGESAFEGCKQLQTVTFGEGSQLTSIGEYAFYKCSSLTGITIPSSVTSIGKSAFDSCSQLQTVDLTALNAVPTLGDYSFWHCHDKLELYVKPELVDTFKAADGWKEYKDNIVPGPVPSIN